MEEEKQKEETITRARRKIRRGKRIRREGEGKGGRAK